MDESSLANIVLRFGTWFFATDWNHIKLVHSLKLELVRSVQDFGYPLAVEILWSKLHF